MKRLGWIEKESFCVRFSPSLESFEEYLKKNVLLPFWRIREFPKIDGKG
jgi:hypothetical protein